MSHSFVFCHIWQLKFDSFSSLCFNQSYIFSYVPELDMKEKSNLYPINYDILCNSIQNVDQHACMIGLYRSICVYHGAGPVPWPYSFIQPVTSVNAYVVIRWSALTVVRAVYICHWILIVYIIYIIMVV